VGRDDYYEATMLTRCTSGDTPELLGQRGVPYCILPFAHSHSPIHNCRNNGCISRINAYSSAFLHGLREKCVSLRAVSLTTPTEVERFVHM